MKRPSGVTPEGYFRRMPRAASGLVNAVALSPVVVNGVLRIVPLLFETACIPTSRHASSSEGSSPTIGPNFEAVHGSAP